MDPCFIDSDDFGDEDSTDLGPNWREVSGNWRLSSGELTLIRPTVHTTDALLRKTQTGSHGSDAYLVVELPDALLDLDADEDVFNAFPTTPASDGQTIETWRDLIAAKEYTNAVAGGRPIFRSSPTGFNGQPAVDFDGTRTLRMGSPNLSGQDGAFFMAVRINNLADAGTVLGAGKSDTTQWLQFIPYLSAANPNPAIRARFGGVTKTARGSTTISAGVTYVIAITSNGSAHRIWVNNVENTVTETNSPAGCWFGDVTTDVYALAALFTNSSSDVIDAKMAKILVYPALTDNQVAAVNSTLMTRFGI